MQNMDTVLVPIERKEGVTIYGQIDPRTKKLCKFQVYSKYVGDNGSVYQLLSDAQRRMGMLINIKSK